MEWGPAPPSLDRLGAVRTPLRLARTVDINRVADCLGVDLEPEMGEQPAGW